LVASLSSEEFSTKPAPLPPSDRFALGWSPFPAIAGQDEGGATRSVVEGASDSTFHFRRKSFRRGPRPFHHPIASRSDGPPSPLSRGRTKVAQREAWWRGRLTRRFVVVERIFDEARAPSTIRSLGARMVPLPRYRGAGRRWRNAKRGGGGV